MDSWKLCCLYGPVYIQRKQFFRYRNIEYKSISKTCESLHVYSIQKRPYKTYNKKYVLGVLKRYVRINTEELNSQKIKNIFSLG